VNVELYPHDALLNFVPVSVRELVKDSEHLPLVSTQLFADHRDALTGPVLEVTWPGTSALLGVMTAARQSDAVLVVSIPAELTALGVEAQRTLIESILSVADESRFDRPLAIVGAVRGLAAVAEDRLVEALYPQVAAGFTAINLLPAELGDDAAELIEAAGRPLVEQGIGLELELDGLDFPGLVLAQLDEAGVPIAAVHGADPFDEIGDAFIVVDPLEDELHDDAGIRVRLDGFLITALTRTLPIKERLRLRADVVSFGAPCAFAERLELFSSLPVEERRRLETFAYAEAVEAIKNLQGDEVASDLIDSIGAEIAADKPPGGNG
jgi:hypothetical protein